MLSGANTFKRILIIYAFQTKYEHQKLFAFENICSQSVAVPPKTVCQPGAQFHPNKSKNHAAAENGFRRRNTQNPL